MSKAGGWGKSTGFGLRLAELRRAAGLSQAKLAKASGVSLSAVTAVEQGRYEPGWPLVIRLADALKVGVGEFRPGKEKAPGGCPRGE